MCEPGPKPVETLHIVRGEGAGAARTCQHQMCQRKSPVSVADHRVQNPAGIEGSLYLPIPPTLQPTPALHMQRPADRNRAEGRYPKKRGARWVIIESPHTLTEDRCCLRVLGITVAKRGIGPQESHAAPAMRNELMKQGRDSNHRTLGGQPKAAHCFKMLDCSQPTGSDAVALHLTPLSLTADMTERQMITTNIANFCELASDDRPKPAQGP